MKKICYFAMCGFLFAALVPQKAMAVATYENHVVKLTAVPEGAGVVYLAADWNGHEKDVIPSASYVEKETTVKATIETKDNKAVCNLYARANAGYKFVGFYLDEDGDGKFDKDVDTPITYAGDGGLDTWYSDSFFGASRTDYTQSPALQVYLSHESPKEYSGYKDESNNEQASLNKAAAEAAAESDWAEFGCLNNFLAVFEEAETRTIVVSSLGAATFCSDKRVDFSNAKDVKPYKASDFSENKVTLTTVGTELPENEGVLVIGEEGTYNVPVCDGTATVDGNLLVGVITDTELNKVDGDKTNFILANDDAKGVNFFAVKDGTTLAAGKAYLSLPTADLPTGAQSFGFRFGNGTTGILEVFETADNTPAWYTLDGRKLNAEPTAKGLYIVNGKNVIIK